MLSEVASLLEVTARCRGDRVAEWMKREGEMSDRREDRGMEHVELTASGRMDLKS